MSVLFKRAGDVIGTPDWQLNRMYETETAQILEAQYAEEDLPVSSIESEFSTAKHFLGQAVVHLVRAANEVEKYRKADQIDALIEKLDDDIPYEMDKVIKQLKEGA